MAIEDRQVIQHLRTSGVTAPAESAITDGEIALSMDNTNPKMFFKKNNGEFAEFVDKQYVDNVSKGHTYNATKDSLAEGIDSTKGTLNTASGVRSHAEGVGNIANNEGEHVEGKYNQSIEGVSQHTVGIGTSHDARKNAHLITTDGKHYIPDVGGYIGTETGLTGVKDVATVISGMNQELDIISTQLESFYCYGIEFDTTVSSPSCTRIGNMTLHRTLPVQSKMRGCLLSDNGEVNEYLPDDDWTTSTRDGSMGQVMVEIPEHYRKFETDGTKRRVWISEKPVQGYTKVPISYCSAYEATIQRSVSKLASVVNMDPDYRGGGNQSSWDETYRTVLGRPVTSISRTNFRNYARRRKTNSTQWNCMTYDMQKTIYWFFAIEYATLNTQAEYTSQLTVEGYHKGGLGPGVTNWSSTNWSNFNGYNPFVPCGCTDSLGNHTGVVNYTASNGEDITVTSAVPRYRGIENPFGHIWQWTDGINVRINPTTENGGNNLSEVFVCSNPADFSDSSYDGYTYVGNEARTEGYMKEAIFGEGGEIIPSAVGGGSSTYFCDYHYTNIPTTTTLRGDLFGGSAYYGSLAGFVYASSDNAPSRTSASIGSRLCFLP